VSEVSRWTKTSSEDRRWFLGANHIGTYMRRWYVLTPWFSIRLHHILRSDEARALHDHPWSFTSFLLTGGYTEVTAPAVLLDGDGLKFDPANGPFTETYYPRWSIVHRPAGAAHRLILDRPLWTLCITGPNVRKWGFHLPGRGWVHWLQAYREWQA
jgi:hypothetical protein